MQTTAIGNRAEQAAVEYLERLGYIIVARNWRKRVCEIDIVAQHFGTVHFVEVKYRATDQAGSGIEYIMHKKLRQMAFAAECWVQDNKWRGEYVLAAIEVGGETYDVTEFVDCIY